MENTNKDHQVSLVKQLSIEIPTKKEKSSKTAPLITVVRNLCKPWKKNQDPLGYSMTGWRNFDKEQKAKYPIRWFLFDTIPHELHYKKYYWNRKLWEFNHKYIPKHKYHIIRTSLEPNYYDPNTRILYAVMDMVKEFVELTKHTVSWDDEPNHNHAWKELNEVYDWWVHKYPKRSLPDLPDIDFDEKIMGDNVEKYVNDPDVLHWRQVSKDRDDLENQWSKEEETMLIRVIKVRNFLWYP